VLAVVQEEQQAPGPQRVGERGQQGPTPLLAHPDGGGHGLGHQPRVAQRGQLHQPGAVGVRGQRLGGRLQGQPGLAGAPHAGERHQPVGAQQGRHLPQFALAPHEAGQLQGQVVRPRVQRSQRGELAGQFRVDELVHPLGPLQVPQPMLAQVAQPGPRREGVPHQVVGGLGQHRLPPVGRGRQPGAAVERRPEVVATLALDLPRVEAHPGSEFAHFAPSLRPQGQLPGEGGRDGVRRLGEGGVDRVAHRLEDDPPLRLHRPAEEVVVAAHGLAVGGGVGLEQAGAPLQVGEQERHRPLRQRRRRRRSR
jgi:hypothetical protein